MPAKPTPDLAHCPDCRKVIGPHKGWFGAECQCGMKLKTVPAHSAGQERK